MDKENVNADYQRIKQVMNYLNFSSDKRFAETIDVSLQNLYDIKAGKKGITHFIADSITKKFPQLSKSYIMLGEGEMLVSAPLQNIQGSNNHHNNGSDARYIAHLEAEIEALRKEKEELWTLVQKLTQR